jgi:hypothetical protein
MSEPTPKPQRRVERGPTKDIAPVIKGWDYEAGTINVRKVSGIDGVPKLQLRLDLGLLQMEMTGRPDGNRPHGHESLLEYFETKLGDHREKSGSEAGFHLTGSQCQALREEATMYYHRYLSLFVLEEFAAVVRDTDRNLRVLDICRKFAQSEADRVVMEQYRPYITMMNARAKASLLFKAERYAEALEAIRVGLKSIKRFFRRFGQMEVYKHANEVVVLKRFARDIRKKLPIDPVELLQKKLEKAVAAERYEDAAKLRDELTVLQAQREGGDGLEPV